MPCGTETDLPNPHAVDNSAYLARIEQARADVQAFLADGDAAHLVDAFVPGPEFAECVRPACPAFHHQYGDRLYYQWQTAPSGVHLPEVDPRPNNLAAIRQRDREVIARLGNPDTDPLLRAEMDRRWLLEKIDQLADQLTGP